MVDMHETIFTDNVVEQAHDEKVWCEKTKDMKSINECLMYK
jgi:hypothetical protein